jgi:DNA-binding transcriptional ArsR family regulator
VPATAERIDVFVAIADPTRRAILDRLRGGRAPVNELASGFDMSRPAVSKHLRILREADLVREKKEGRFRYYELTPSQLEKVAAWAETYRAFWATSLHALKQHVESRRAALERAAAHDTAPDEPAKQDRRPRPPGAKSPTRGSR